MATVEEKGADKCPYCASIGKAIQTMKVPDYPGDKLRVFQCQNKLCLDPLGRWLVQTDANGDVAERQAGPKSFEINEHAAASAPHLRERVIEQMEEDKRMLNEEGKTREIR